MTTQFSDFLAAHAGRIGELWRRAAPDVTAPDLPHVDARQFMSAILVALTADDRRPLETLYRLGDASGVESRLDVALRHLQVLAGAGDAAAAEQRIEAETRRALTLAANEEIGAVGRHLATSCVERLRSQLASASSSSSSRATSLSITMHELRRPLTILSSYGQLLATGMLGALPESATAAIEGITASTDQMVRMVAAIAELARLEDPDDQLVIEVMNPAEIVTAATEQIAVEAQLRGITITSNVPPGTKIAGDRRRLVLALTNLLGNAVKHGPAESPVEVAVRVEEGQARFTVRDHGAGFAPEDASHLFDKYFRSVSGKKRTAPGSGLGLYIVRTVAERHRGSVAARNLEGEGAEFEMIIPMYEQQR